MNVGEFHHFVLKSVFVLRTHPVRNFFYLEIFMRIRHLTLLGLCCWSRSFFLHTGEKTETCERSEQQEFVARLSQ